MITKLRVEEKLAAELLKLKSFEPLA